MNALNKKGQFFSPDLVIAVGIFIFSLALFWAASNAVFAQTDLLGGRNESDEVSHYLLTSLVLSSGQPNDWEDYSLADINSFGLVHSSNILDINKTVELIGLLNSPDYNSVKHKLGLGKYDLQLNVLNSNGEIISSPSDLSGGIVLNNYVLKASYSRIVFFDNEPALIQAVLSIGE